MLLNSPFSFESRKIGAAVCSNRLYHLTLIEVILESLEFKPLVVLISTAETKNNKLCWQSSPLESLQTKRSRVSMTAKHLLVMKRPHQSVPICQFLLTISLHNSSSLNDAKNWFFKSEFHFFIPTNLLKREILSDLSLTPKTLAQSLGKNRSNWTRFRLWMTPNDAWQGRFRSRFLDKERGLWTIVKPNRCKPCKKFLPRTFL